jgi:hypothetical protein
VALSKAERLERERIEEEWRANEARVHHYGDLFDALPSGAPKDALLAAMTDRIIDLYNNVRMEEGDAILEFLPNIYARQLLDWYFDDEDPNSVFSPEAPNCSDEASEPEQVQGGTQGSLGANGGGAVEAHTSEATKLSVAPAEPAGTDRREPGRSQ